MSHWRCDSWFILSKETGAQRIKKREKEEKSGERDGERERERERVRKRENERRMVFTWARITGLITGWDQFSLWVLFNFTSLLSPRFIVQKGGWFPSSEAVTLMLFLRALFFLPVFSSLILSAKNRLPPWLLKRLPLASATLLNYCPSLLHSSCWSCSLSRRNLPSEWCWWCPSCFSLSLSLSLSLDLCDHHLCFLFPRGSCESNSPFHFVPLHEATSRSRRRRRRWWWRGWRRVRSGVRRTVTCVLVVRAGAPVSCNGSCCCCCLWGGERGKRVESIHVHLTGAKSCSSKGERERGRRPSRMKYRSGPPLPHPEKEKEREAAVWLLIH